MASNFTKVLVFVLWFVLFSRLSVLWDLWHVQCRRQCSALLSSGVGVVVVVVVVVVVLLLLSRLCED